MAHTSLKIATGVFAVALSMASIALHAAEPAPRSGRATTRAASTQPNYPVPYKTPRVEHIIEQLKLVKGEIERSTQTKAASRPAGETEKDGRRFALVSYPMGVIYNGMLSAADATGDQSFAQFDADRFQIFANDLAKMDDAAKAHPERRKNGDVALMLSPQSLDNCGAIGIALVKARRTGVGPDLKILVDHIAQYISHKQLRLDDGTLARSRPFHDSIWADDAYMGIPYLAEMGALTGNKTYFDDAAAQILHFQDHLFVPATGFFTHHYSTSNPDYQPTYYWARANGWCTMAMVEVLDVLPEDHPLRGRVLRLFREHCKALASAQAGDGLWHQMLDRIDTYTETSASAMFTYCLARGVNKGWLDIGYAPVAQAGWNGLSVRIDEQGHITGTCVGTGYADDYVYYYHRPSVDDIHGYGPVLLAGSEMIRLIRNTNLRIAPQTSSNPVIYQDRSMPPAEVP
jgi:rhamnogalacturonyl hydrolase YesR